MTGKEKKAFAERMKKARAAKKRGAKKPVTTRVRPAAGASRVTVRKRPGSAQSRPAKTRPASPKAARPAASPKKARRQSKRRNPDTLSDASAMYETFHGRAPEHVTERTEALKFRDSLAELGKLLELRFRLDGQRQPVPLIGFGACQVTCTPDGTNIYFLGGSQAVDLSSLGIDSDKDLVCLGECTYIRYFTRKGFHNFEPVEYFHAFGEETGIRPMLCYDSQNRKLFLSGGDYRVKAEGITN